MRIDIVAVGTRMPRWVDEGFQEYAPRLKGDCRMSLKPIALAHRRKNKNIHQVLADEAKRLLGAVGKDNFLIAMDQAGKSLNTADIAAKLSELKQSGRDLSILIGGPDGLHQCCLDRSDLVWSLSALTLPHGLVRVILAEALYRAWTLGHNHPYHRA